MLKMGLHAGFIGASVTGLSSKDFTFVVQIFPKIIKFSKTACSSKLFTLPAIFFHSYIRDARDILRLCLNLFWVGNTKKREGGKYAKHADN